MFGIGERLKEVSAFTLEQVREAKTLKERFKFAYDADIANELLGYGVSMASVWLISPVLFPAGIVRRSVLEVRKARKGRIINPIPHELDPYGPDVKYNWKAADQMTALPVEAPIRATGALATAAALYTSKIIALPVRLGIYIAEGKERAELAQSWKNYKNVKSKYF